MSTNHDPAITLFAAVARQHGQAWVPSASPKFGSNALRVNGKIYAALTRKHRLLLKLPPARIEELLAARRVERFESGRRAMNGWVTSTSGSVDDWIALSNEARAFLTTEATKPRRATR
jgi:hypothetical protein